MGVPHDEPNDVRDDREVTCYSSLFGSISNFWPRPNYSIWHYALFFLRPIFPVQSFPCELFTSEGKL